jgi:hypothetical protein
MLVALGVLMIGVAILLLVASVGVRQWSSGQAATEAHLHEPGAHTVTYVLPDGEDPVSVLAALSHAGFTSVEDHAGVHDRVLVECGDEDREQVREVIAHVEHREYDGAAVAGRVVFEDER